MKLVETLLWLAYSVFGFLLCTFYGLVLRASALVLDGSRMGGDHPRELAALFWTDLTAIVGIALFCSTLLWVADSNCSLARLRVMKLSVILLLVQTILFWGLCTYTAACSGDFRTVFLIHGPLWFAFAVRTIRGKSCLPSTTAGGDSATVPFCAKVYVIVVFCILVAIWNLMAFGDMVLHKSCDLYSEHVDRR